VRLCAEKCYQVREGEGRRREKEWFVLRKCESDGKLLLKCTRQ
jgi:hypothetical protein